MRYAVYQGLALRCGSARMYAMWQMLYAKYYTHSHYIRASRYDAVVLGLNPKP